MTPMVPSRDDPSTYPIAAGLSMAWQKQGKVVVFTWTSISRETIDDFAKAYRVMIANWPVQEPLNQLNDLRFKGFSFTPYLRNTVEQVISESNKHGITGRVANLMTPGLIMRVVQFFLRATAFSPGVQAQIFADFDQAMAWLQE